MIFNVLLVATKQIVIHRVSVTDHVHLLFTNILYGSAVDFFTLAFFHACFPHVFILLLYNIVKIGSASRLSLFLTILYNRK